MNTTPPSQSRPDVCRVDADSPWLGLLPFTETTQRYFFGRDAEIREMAIRVRSQALTVLYGQSGLGKTSLLGAGLLPALRASRCRPVLLRLRFEKQDPPPLEQLRQALVRAYTEDADAAAALYARWGESPLWYCLHHLDLRPTGMGNETPVVLFDQFEEVYTLGVTQRSRQEIMALAENLAELTENRPSSELQALLAEEPGRSADFDFEPAPLRMVLTLREDYLSHLEAWKTFFPSLMRNRMALHRLGGKQAWEAVVKPGRLDGRNIVSDEVAHQIVCCIASKPAGTPLEEIDAVPPLLSLLCDELNRARGAEPQITAALVAARHGGILQDFYTRSFDGLHPSVRRLVEDRMVTEVGGYRNQIPRMDAEAELVREGVDHPAEALGTLVERRLLSSEERDGLQRLELTHDILAPLVEQSRDKRQGRERAEKAEAAKLEAEAREAKEARKQRRLMVLAIVATAGMLTGYGGMVKAKSEQVRASASAAQALAEKKRAVLAEKQADQARADAEELTRFMSEQLLDKLKPLGRVNILLTLNDRLQTYYRALPASQQTPDSYRRKAFVDLDRGDIMKCLGQETKLPELYQKALTVFVTLAAATPDNPQSQADLGECYLRLALVLTGDEAKRNGNKALAIFQHLSARAPVDYHWQMKVLECRVALGRPLLYDEGRALDALSSCHEAVILADKLVTVNPNNDQWQFDLSYAYLQIARAYYARSDLDQTEGKRCSQVAHEIIARLAAKTPANSLWQTQLAASYNLRGNYRLAAGDPAGALSLYATARSTAQLLVSYDPANAQYQHSLALICNNAGQALLQKGDVPNARRYFEERFRISQQLAKLDPTNDDWQNSLFAALCKLGDVNKAAKNLGAAMEKYTDGLSSMYRLAAANPQNPIWQKNLWRSHINLGDLAALQGEKNKARIHYEAGAAILRSLRSREPDSSAWQWAETITRKKLVVIDPSVSGKSVQSFVDNRDD